MDKSLSAICNALKKILSHLKPQQNAISFILMTGKMKQGKSALLRQSNLTLFPVDSEGAQFYYNQQGIILELGESWLNQTENLIAYTLKQLNRCHRNVRISGIMLCVDANELLITEPSHLTERAKSHTQLLQRFARGLGYPVDLALLFTKLDVLAGFCDFFQTDHPSDLAKPVGFSVQYSKQRKKLLDHYRLQFDHMIEMLGQQVINKLHPARSTLKRTHIREFPLQLASLAVPIYSLIQNIPLQFFRLQAIYFTSAEQGGFSVDRLNQKIQHEYALMIQDKSAQSHNYRPYFIEGAIAAFQEQTKRHIPKLNSTQRWLSGAAVGSVGILMILLMTKYFKTAQILDETSKELLTYETLLQQTQDSTLALYHLSLASNKIEQIPHSLFQVSVIDQLKKQLHQKSKLRLQENFLPELILSIEEIIADPNQSLIERYNALKIYLMLGEQDHFSEKEILQWFDQYWRNKNQQSNNEKHLLLLKTVLKQPMQPITINQQIVSDVRNYLNALPGSYLYYSLAKNYFPKEKETLEVKGFDLATKELPYYYTTRGFREEIAALPNIAKQLQQENWVLARQDLRNLPLLLEEAYCFEYMTWWQNFIRHTKPKHYLGFQEAKETVQTLHQNHSLQKMLELIQQHTAPEMDGNSSLFNEKIAHAFTTLNVISTSAFQDLSQNLYELEKFLTTVSLVKDEGHTLFELTKTRFQGNTASDPLSILYARSHQLPEPMSVWTKQIADDTWTIFINESRYYLNKQWEDKVFREYQNTIANRYPLQAGQGTEISLQDFNHFFAPHGTLNSFVNTYLKPFLNTSIPQWQPKELNGFVLPISNDLINELIRANIISNMFFLGGSEISRIEFNLQKISLDPVVSNLQLNIGNNKLTDNQSSESYTQFSWPQNDAKLILNSIEGKHYELAETGPWAFFKMLEKVNVLVDNNDSSSLQILFEVNGNSGRYVLKTQNPINPFSPGILTGFVLKKEVS